MNTSTRTRPLVVGVDGENFAAAHYALDEARSRGCGVRIVHAYRLPVPAVPGLLIDDQAIEQAQAAAQGVIDLFGLQVDAEGADVPVEYRLGYASPTELLLEEAKTARALILGTDDVGWFDHLLLGDVSSWLSSRTACPVVVVPAKWSAPDPRGGDVVVTLEGTSSAQGPLAYAFEQADRTGQSLHVLHVSPPGTREDDDNERRVNLAEILAGWSESFPDVEVFTTIISGKVDDSILRETCLASLVVVGRTNRHGFPFSLARPTAVAVIKQAQCPVAIVPSDHEA